MENSPKLVSTTWFIINQISCFWIAHTKLINWCLGSCCFAAELKSKMLHSNTWFICEQILNVSLKLLLLHIHCYKCCKWMAWFLYSVVLCSLFSFNITSTLYLHEQIVCVYYTFMKIFCFFKSSTRMIVEDYFKVRAILFGLFPSWTLSLCFFKFPFSTVS